MAVGAGTGAILIGWLITGSGVLTLAFVYQMLAKRKPELDNGIYACALAGEYVGDTGRRCGNADRARYCVVVN